MGAEHCPASYTQLPPRPITLPCCSGAPRTGRLRRARCSAARALGLRAPLGGNADLESAQIWAWSSTLGVIASQVWTCLQETFRAMRLRHARTLREPPSSLRAFGTDADGRVGEKWA